MQTSDLQDEQIRSKRKVILKKLHQLKSSNANPPLVTKPEELGKAVDTSGGGQPNPLEDDDKDNVPRDTGKKLKKALEENKDLKLQRLTPENKDT